MYIKKNYILRDKIFYKKEAVYHKCYIVIM